MLIISARGITSLEVCQMRVVNRSRFAVGLFAVASLIAIGAAILTHYPTLAASPTLQLVLGLLGVVLGIVALIERRVLAKLWGLEVGLHIRFLLYGVGGSGKTSLIKYLTAGRPPSNPPLPTERVDPIRTVQANAGEIYDLITI